MYGGQSSKGFLADHHLLLSKQRNDTELKVEWYPIYGPKSLFKSVVKKDQLCAIALVNRKLILKVLLKMVAMATSHSLLR